MVSGVKPRLNGVQQVLVDLHNSLVVPREAFVPQSQITMVFLSHHDRDGVGDPAGARRGVGKAAEGGITCLALAGGEERHVSTTGRGQGWSVDQSKGSEDCGLHGVYVGLYMVQPGGEVEMGTGV